MDLNEIPRTPSHRRRNQRFSESYFEDGSSTITCAKSLAKNGIEVDRAIEMDGPGTILGSIKDKVHVDCYEKWKTIH